MTEARRIRPWTHDGAPARAARGGVALPPDLLREASRRLELAALLVALGYAVALTLMLGTFAAGCPRKVSATWCSCWAAAT